MNMGVKIDRKSVVNCIKVNERGGTIEVLSQSHPYLELSRSSLI